MWNRKRSVTLSIAVCFVFAVILTMGLFLGPWTVKMWFSLYRGLDPDGEDLRLLLNIGGVYIFVNENVRSLRRISWCCFAVALITGLGGVQYIPFLFIAIAAAFMGLLLRIVKNVMQSAVIIKTENELTI